MYRVAAVFAALSLFACQSEHFETSYRADSDAGLDDPEAHPFRAEKVIVDIGMLCPGDQQLAVELMVEGRMFPHEIFDAFEPCAAPRQDVRAWPGIDG